MKKKKKRIPKSYNVYAIYVDGVIRYVGRTNNLKRRQSEHRRSYRNSDKKLIYDYMREHKVVSEDIELILLLNTKDKTRSKRYEMHLILIDYFGNQELKQRIPNISDR